MCNPSIPLASALLNTITTAGPLVVNMKSQRDNYKYRSQIAQNNAKAAENEALRQKQLGIEEARKDRLEGIANANYELARSSSSGFDINSNTSKINYEDNIARGELNSSFTKREYDQKANDYYRKANSYLNQAENERKSYNDSVFLNAIYGLGKMNSVASYWKPQDITSGGVL